MYWGYDHTTAGLSLLNSELKGLLFGVPANDRSVQAMKQRHGGKWNVSFCDVHMETLRPVDLFNMTNVAVAQRWNYDHQPRDWLFPLPQSN